MKKYLFIITALALIGQGCSKKSDSKPSMDYVVNGISDQQVTQYRDTTIYMPLGINFVSGTQENVTITASNIPPGSTFSPATISGIPSFAVICTLRVLPLVSGNIPVTIKGTDASGNTKSFSFNLVSAADAYCQDMYLDSFYFSDTLFNAADNSVFQINNSIIVPFKGTGSESTKLYVYGDKINIDCSSANVTIDPYSNVNVTASAGSGIRDNNHIDYSYYLTINSSGTTLINKAHLTRK